jgi:type I restriction enzyme R subunit
VKAHLRFDDPEWDGDPAAIIIDPPEPKVPRLPKGEGPEPGDEPHGGEPPPGGSTEPRPEMIQIELVQGQIIHIAATTFWGPNGKPMSAKDFIERMFGELPDLFKDEDELRILWGDPDTRKALLERLSERGYDLTVLKQIRTAIMAEKSDLFDVLAHIAYAVEPKTRAQRAEQGEAAIKLSYNPKLAVFLHYVLGQYVDADADGLDRAHLPDYLKLQYGTFADGARMLGGADVVAKSFAGFQKFLYE